MLIDFLLRPFSEWHDWRCDVGGGKTKKNITTRRFEKEKKEEVIERA
jgi:hypothetical protein